MLRANELRGERTKLDLVESETRDARVNEERKQRVFIVDNMMLWFMNL